MRMFFILVSLLPLCGSTSHECNSTLLKDYDFPGSDIKSLYAPDAVYCQMLCTQYPSCEFFTFVCPNSTVDARHFFCFLKMSTSGKPPSQVAKQGSTAGYSLRPCHPDQRPCLSQLYENMDFVGYEYRTLFTETVEECQKVCTADPGCQFFSYGKEGFHIPTEQYLCVLQFSWTIPTPPQIEANSDAISGFSLRLFRGRHHHRGYQARLFPDVDCPGNDITNIPAASPEHCQTLCSAHPQCTYFSYYSSQFKCYLKNNPTSRSCHAAAGFTSGMPVRSCLVDNSWSRMTFQGEDFKNSDIESFLVDSAEMCQKNCSENCNCQFFTYRISSKLCYLKRVITLPTIYIIAVLENVVSGFNLRNCRCRSRLRGKDRD